MKFLLMERGCWPFIEVTELPLNETTATRQDKSEYKERQDTALAAIYYGIDEQYRTLISSTTSSSKAWIILKELFEPISRASVIRLLDEFFSIKFNRDTESIVVFIVRIRKMVERLKDVGHPLNDMYCAFQASIFCPSLMIFSRMVTCFPLDEKSQVFEWFKSFQANAEKVLNRKILSVRCDNGMEFCHTKFSKYLNELGIGCERTNTYTPEQNGVSKRFNLTAMDCVKAMLNTSGIENCFWAEALDDPEESGKAVVGDSSRENASVENASNLKLGSSIPFYREAILRQSGKMYDIYYCIKDKDVRLRSFKDVEKYYKDNDILYDKSIFDFNSTEDHNANRLTASNIEVLIPRHFKDAKNSPQSDKWQNAMCDIFEGSEFPSSDSQ
ncbi:f-box only protein 38 [Trichonephila clavipes]|nr:f-box only protein 38 [Trichonephila clavipes]